MRTLGMILSLLSLLAVAGCGPLPPWSGGSLTGTCPNASQKLFYSVEVVQGLCAEERSWCGPDGKTAAANERATLQGSYQTATLFMCDASTVNPAGLCTVGQPVGALPAGCSQQ
jgi:hypothetical protein